MFSIPSELEVFGIPFLARNRGVSNPCLYFMCDVYRSLRGKIILQISQEYFFDSKSRWHLMCDKSELRLLTVLPQRRHLKTNSKMKILSISKMDLARMCNLLEYARLNMPIYVIEQHGVAF